MAAQERSAKTRQRIVDAAVELFAERGYGGTALKDIAERAQITGGTFYYHFDSKEALADAVIENGWPKARQILLGYTQARSPSLENVIVMTFEISDLLRRDKAVWVSNHLNHAFGQLSKEGIHGFRARATTFTEAITKAISSTEIRDDIAPETIGELVWISLHGCLLLSDAMADDVFNRLAHCWQAMLRAILPEESLEYFQQFVARQAMSYAAHEESGG